MALSIPFVDFFVYTVDSRSPVVRRPSIPSISTIGFHFNRGVHFCRRIDTVRLVSPSDSGRFPFSDVGRMTHHSSPPSLIRSVRRRAVEGADDLAWIDIDADRKATNSQWNALIDHIADDLRDRSISPGDRVGYLGHNHWVTWTLAAATWEVGADFWPINYRWTAREMGRSFKRLGGRPKLVVASDRYRDRIPDSVPGNEATTIVDRSHFIDGLPTQTAPGDPSRHTPKALSQTPGHLIMATGGTTGQPRLVGLDAHQVATGARMFVESTGLESDEMVLVCAPNFHVAGFAALTTAAITCGASLAIADRFRSTRIADVIAEYPIAATVMVPTMWRRLFDELESRSQRLDSMRFGICGGAPMPPSLVDRAAALGTELLQGYGMTEAGPMVTLMPPGAIDDGRHHRKDSAGCAPEAIDLNIVDDQLESVDAGTPGQIAVRGPNIVDHYLGTSAGDDESFHDGFLLTGDRGYVDDDGFLYVQGRIDNIVITGGENVAPAEVENALLEDEDVGDVAVFGVADADLGQQLVALVVPSSSVTDGPDPEAIKERVRRYLADYKVPKQIHVVETLPQTPAGKVSRSDLAVLWSDLSDDRQFTETDGDGTTP